MGAGPRPARIQNGRVRRPFGEAGRDRLPDKLARSLSRGAKSAIIADRLRRAGEITISRRLTVVRQYCPVVGAGQRRRPLPHPQLQQKEVHGIAPAPMPPDQRDFDCRLSSDSSSISISVSVMSTLPASERAPRHRPKCRRRRNSARRASVLFVATGTEAGRYGKRKRARLWRESLATRIRYVCSGSRGRMRLTWAPWGSRLASSRLLPRSQTKRRTTASPRPVPCSRLPYPE